MTERKCMCPPSCPVNGWRECPISDTQERLMQAEARIAAVEREATDLLDTIWQTLDPEDAEDVVLEAFPKGAPQWVLNWYHEHPSSAELADEEEET